jgi:hypothetical protein
MRCSLSHGDTDFERKAEGENFSDEAILGAIGECPFSSLRQIAIRILISMRTVRYHLVNVLGYQIRNIRWVLHSLSSSQKQAHVAMSQDLLQVLRLAKRHAWKFIVTLDKASFYFSNHFARIWLPHDELPSSFPKQTIASQKLIIAVVWNPRTFHAIQSLSKAIKWTKRYYLDNILSQIAALQDIDSHRKMIIHADNAGPHVAQYVAEYMNHKSLKEHLILLTYLILHHLIFTYLDMSNINYKGMNSGKGQNLFRLSQKF